MTKVEYCNAHQNQFFGGLQSSNSQSDDRYLSLYWLTLKAYVPILIEYVIQVLTVQLLNS
jgi:hypothetical protein